jgi:pimeloyl-ACP methyl ester carboxylesterase
MTPQLSFRGGYDTLVVMTDLFYRDTGRGRPLVLLHGGFLHHQMWDDVVPELATDYRVITPDARGHGRSPVATAPFRPTDDVAALVRHLDLGPVVLMGVSMGAATAVDTALEHPDLVSALVVSGAGTSEPYFTDPWTTRTTAAWYAAMAAGDLDASVEAFTLLGAGPHRTLDDLDPDLVRRLRAMARTTMSKHTAGEPNHIVPVADTWARITSIDVPVLVINGSLDSPDHLAMADRLAAGVPDARSVTIDDVAHYPNMERPEAFIHAVRTFVHP